MLYQILGLACITILFVESTPMKSLKDSIGLLNPTQNMNIYKYRLLELINCNMCSGFLIGVIYHLANQDYNNIILSSAIISISAEIINKILRK